MSKKMKLLKIEIREVLEILRNTYPDAGPELNYNNPFELLIAVILSAQCTDIRVNEVTKVLFHKAPTPEKIVALGLEEIMNIIKPCGLYKNKGKNIFETCKILVNTYESKVPEDIQTLMTLPGVGQKTANVVVSNAYGIPAIAVDTHVFRVSNRIGLVHEKTVEKTEVSLMKAIPQADWIFMHHALIFHGRRVCKARKPECDVCNVNEYCLFNK